METLHYVFTEAAKMIFKGLRRISGIILTRGLEGNIAHLSHIGQFSPCKHLHLFPFIFLTVAHPIPGGPRHYMKLISTFEEEISK
jgi:hypothetical protein